MARYPDAIWVPANPANEGGPIGKIRLVVDHIEQGSESGTNAWFQNAKAQVSAHFGISKLGQVFQFVDTDTTAWAEMNYNDVAISIEHEGVSGDQFTHQQIAAEAKLGAWIHTTHGVPLKRAVRAEESGWITHGELGATGGNHPDCPGKPATAQLPTILKAIEQIVNPKSTPLPSALQLEQNGLVELHHYQEANTAKANGWLLYVWTGFAFAVEGTASSASIARFTSVNWQTPRTPTKGNSGE